MRGRSETWCRRPHCHQLRSSNGRHGAPAIALELLEVGQGLVEDHAPNGAVLRRLGTDEVRVAEVAVAKMSSAPDTAPTFDGKKRCSAVRCRCRGEQQLATGQHHASAIAGAPAQIALLKAPDGASSAPRPRISWHHQALRNQ